MRVSAFIAGLLAGGIAAAYLTRHRQPVGGIRVRVPSPGTSEHFPEGHVAWKTEVILDRDGAAGMAPSAAEIERFLDA